MARYDVVRASELDTEQLTFDDLRYMHGTGRSYTISGTGRDRKMGYRTGVQTPVGDLEISEWCQLLKQLIERSGETELHTLLELWVKEHAPWLHTRGEYEKEALILHSMRIFEDPQWVDYEAFNQFRAQQFGDTTP